MQPKSAIDIGIVGSILFFHISKCLPTSKIDKNSWLYRLKFGKLENKSDDEGTSGAVTANRAHREAVGGGHNTEGAGEPEDSHLTQQDYLQLMKILGIRLPEGVLTPDVIEKANVENTIQDAQAILTELEHFRMGFKVIPRLRCRKVKRCLAMKQNNDILAITKKIFFDHKDDENKGMKNLSLNKTHEGGGFRLRDKYMSGTTISTPAMKTTIKSGTKLEVGELSAIVTKGTEVNVTDLESREYRDETKLQEKKCSSEPQKFGMFSLNKVDELEMLKFFHEQEIRRSGGTRTTSYTTSNKLEYGFLSGRLDFLAKIQEKGEAADQKKCKQRIIECKCTEGDMVGKLYKTINGESVIDPTHKYSYQVQSYMYILSKQTDLQMRPAVMIVRHYHQGGKPPRDINWRYLNMEPAVQTEIDELRIYCQTEALACYLALLNLIYVKET